MACDPIIPQPDPHELSVVPWQPEGASGRLAVIAAAAVIGKIADSTALPLAAIGGTSRAEYWCDGATTRAEAADGAMLRHSSQILFGTLAIDEAAGDICAAAEAGYRALLAHNRRLGFPHLLRVWNYFGAINQGDGDDERYRRFCVGRARVIAEEPPTGFAAATAIGIAAAPSALHLHWLASRRPGVAIENPRQVSAWEYPREYGPVAPGFSRAMLIEDAVEPLLLISGTASIVGHASTVGDALFQLDATLNNLGALIDRAAARVGRASRLGEHSLLRVYLRDAGQAQAVQQRLLERLGAQTPFMLLHGDVCRRELAVEIEAVQRFAGG